jgi:hypothetical protein
VAPAGAELRGLQLGAVCCAPGAGAGRLRGGKNREGPEARPAGVSEAGRASLTGPCHAVAEPAPRAFNSPYFLARWRTARVVRGFCEEANVVGRIASFAIVKQRMSWSFSNL